MLSVRPIQLPILLWNFPDNHCLGQRHQVETQVVVRTKGSQLDISLDLRRAGAACHAGVFEVTAEFTLPYPRRYGDFNAWSIISMHCRTLVPQGY